MVKKFIPFFFGLIALLLLGCEKVNTGEKENLECYFSQKVGELYQDDAKQILFREIQRDTSNHPHYLNPYFDSTEVNHILQALQSIYDLQLPQRDTIVKVRKIHTFPRRSLHFFSLKVNQSSSEIQNLKNGQPTGNAIFDSIFNGFQIKLLRINTLDWADFKTREPLNLYAIVEPLKKLSFVHNAEISGAFGEWNDIKMTRTSGQFQFDFSTGWGDCPAGCIYERHWVFSVNQECQASFVHAYGDVIP